MKSQFRWRAGVALLLGTVCLYAQDGIAGAGATFPSPLYQKWIGAFLQRHPGPRIEYRPIGSGAGVQLLKGGEVDFAASDAPLTDEEMNAFPAKVVHIPTVVGGVVPIYHLEGLVRDIRFTPQTLAAIYAGTIKRWDDPALKSANRGVALPARGIVVVHRSDASGTSYVWTDYLSKLSDAWRSSVGSGTNVKWPAGMGAAGNEGVADLVRSTPDSIGYVEFIYALQAHLSYGAIRNSSGRFVQADLNSLSAAAASFHSGGDLRTSITNASSPRAYPVASFTYLLIPEKTGNPQKASVMLEFLRWALTSGQKQSAALGYAPLPNDVARQALDALGGLH
jgi:phosphate transport system substrate-binding protein